MSRVGLRLPNDPSYPTEKVVESTQFAEELGYDSVWIPEGGAWNGWMTLTRLAAETERIDLATGIVNSYSRTPALLAMSTATLDQFSNGRAILGLGASSRISIEQLHGLPFDRPLRRIREIIEIVNQTMKNDRIDYHGEIFDIDDYPRRFEPYREDVPIYNAGLQKLNRRLTGEFADGWLPIHLPRERMQDFIDDVEEGIRRADRDRSDVTIAPYIVSCVLEDREQAREEVSKQLGFYIGHLDYYAMVFRKFGFENEVDEIRAGFSEGGHEGAADRVPDSLIDSVAIAGTPEESRQRLEEYYDNGVDMPVVYPTSTSQDLIEETIAHLAPE